LTNLWKATVTYYVDVLIASDDEPTDDEMRCAANNEMRENGSTNGGWTEPPEHITRILQLPPSWAGCVPYGDDESNPDERTCLQILDAYEVPREPLGEQTEIEATHERKR
jgi:hypothetical protein